MLFMIGLLFVSCNQEPSLQKYFINKSEQNDFFVMDLSNSFIDTNKMTLSEKEKKALNSFEKINILAFKKDSLNEKKYLTEEGEVKKLLNDKKYQELIRFGNHKEGGKIYALEEGNKIDEFVVFVNQKEKGFVVLRVLGDNMDLSQVMNLASLIGKANLNIDQLKPLGEYLKKN